MKQEDKAPETLIRDLLGEIQRRFYAKRKKEFFEDHKLLRAAVLHPAIFLAPRGVRLPWQRYSEIFVNILATMQSRGNLKAVRRLGAYIGHSVQEHMRHHWDEYYQESRELEDALRANLHAFRSAKIAEPRRDVIADLSQIAAVIIPKGGRPKKAKPSPPEAQTELF